MTNSIEYSIKFLPEFEKNSEKFGVFVDDNQFYVEEWIKMFRGVSGFKPIAPKIEGESIFHHMHVKAFRETCTQELLKRVAVVTIDQFRFDSDSWEQGQLFLNDLREVNSQAWVVETSAAPTRRPIYIGSNTILDTMLISDAKKFISKSPITIGARLQAFRYFTVEPFIEAQYADPKNVNDQFRPETSLSRLTKSLKYNELLKILQVSTDTLIVDLASLEHNEQLEMLHLMWDMVGHISIGNSENEYAGTLTRLRKILETI